MNFCARTGCPKVLTSNSASSYFCSDNCAVAWTAANWGIDQFPTPSHDQYPRQLRHPRDEPLPWLEGR